MTAFTNDGVRSSAPRPVAWLLLSPPVPSKRKPDQRCSGGDNEAVSFGPSQRTRGLPGSALLAGSRVSPRVQSAGPLVGGDLALDLSAIAAVYERLWRLAGEVADVGHPDGGHHGPGWLVDCERLGEDATQTDVHEPIAQQFARALAGESLPPPSTQEPVAEIGLARYPRLIGAVRRLQHPTANELPCVESDPDSETGDLLPCAQSASVSLLNLRSCEAATIEVAE